MKQMHFSSELHKMRRHFDVEPVTPCTFPTPLNVTAFQRICGKGKFWCFLEEHALLLSAYNYLHLPYICDYDNRVTKDESLVIDEAVRRAEALNNIEIAGQTLNNNNSR